MSWRTVIISQRCKLDLKMGSMVVRAEETQRVLLDEVAVIIVENMAVSITACLLNEISSRKIKLIFCDNKKNPTSELVSIYGAHDSSAKLRSQISWKDETKAFVWTAIVSDKIRKQAQVLTKLNRENEANILNKYVDEIEINDTTNREGHAAKVYFNAIFGMEFNRNAENSINGALNYGYSIILSAVNREVVASGYLTQFGLFHDNMFNFFNLSCDIMEPFRPLVDSIVLKKKYNLFESEEKHNLVNSIMNTQIIIGGTKQYILYGIRLYCKSVFEALNKNDVTLIQAYDMMEEMWEDEL